MSETEYDLTTDPKWTSFLAAFDKNKPEQSTLSQLRDTVERTLDEAEDLLRAVAGGESKTKFLSAIGMLRNELTGSDHIERLAEREKKIQALLKTAVELKGRCEAEKKKAEKKLGQQKSAGVYAVQALVAKVEKVQHPALQNYLQPFLDPVKQAVETAQQKKSVSAIADAMTKIDSSELEQAHQKIFFIQMKLEQIEVRLADAQRILDELPDGVRDGEDYDGVTSDLENVRQEFQEILKAGYDDLDKDIGALYKTAITLKNRAEQLTSSEQAADALKTENLLKPLTLVLKEADKILTTCNVTGLKGRLEDLQEAMETAAAGRDTALQADTDEKRQENVEALYVPVQVAIAKVQDALKGVPRMLANVGDLLATLKDGKLKTALGQSLENLKADFEEAVQSGDDLDSIKDKLVQAIEQVAKDTKQDKYKLLLQTQFGVTAERKGLPFKKNLKGTYEAMCMVPDSHVGQDKLQKIVFDYGKPVPYGEYDDTVVTMTSKLYDFTKPTYMAYKLMYKEPPFTVDGTAYEPNAFNITILHEIGHSIDDKQDIMSPREGSAGYGQWKYEGAEGVIDVCTNHLVNKLGLSDDGAKAAIRDCITTAVGGKSPKQPRALGRTQWGDVKKLCEAVLASRAGKEPWYKPDKAINIDGRVYQEPYGNDWVSYALADRTGSVTVSSYQWRAPGEFFACIYSVAWMKGATPGSLAGLFDDWMPEKQKNQ